MDLTAFQQSVPLEGNPLDHIDLTNDRNCSIELHDATEWRRDNRKHRSSRVLN